MVAKTVHEDELASNCFSLPMAICVTVLDVLILML